MARPKRWKSCMSENLLTMLTVLGVLSGVALGFILRASKSTAWSKRDIMYVNFVGDIFLRMLKALILPLIVGSIITAIGSLDLSLSGRIGMRSIYYYATTTVTAVILGIILVLSIRPGVVSTEGGVFVANPGDYKPPRNITTTDTLLDLVRNIFPSNLVQACLKHLIVCTTGILTMSTTTVPTHLVLSYLELFWVSLSEKWGTLLLEINDFGVVVGTLGWYFMTVLLGLFIHGFGTLSVIYFVCTRELPFKSISQMGQVAVTAFGTASSSATLPITLQCLDKMGLDPRITRFVVPIGATINMDGTAFVTATAASIGAAGIPQAGLVTMVMVLDTVGLPPEDVSLIIAVDWLLDRFRTTINVVCDALGACIIEKMSRGELDATNARQQEEAVELTQLSKTEA
ncbi:hypothetical protein G9C98_007231 [Cotesia typhae]|uniref:Amino acid transporter n=1 Tax=Cotesia typhae TaxID=2053667 RepID=A0A8J5UTS6_9HYME|nr:hypothetical protein G9C98_007231 [Cotesia typhae]